MFIRILRSPWEPRDTAAFLNLPHHNLKDMVLDIEEGRKV